jgi:hypothetical protein
MAEHIEWAEEILRDIFAREWLNSVVFVMDYVQFTFNGPTLTAVVAPTIEISGCVLRWGDPGFRDALCDQIAHSVVEANVWKGDNVELTFDTGAIMRISLRVDDLVGSNPESAIFMANLPSDKRWFVLRPGD